MLTNVILIPFFLALDANVSEVSDFTPEYVYELNKTTVLYREPLQIMQTTSTMTCHASPPRSLNCFLHDVLFVTTLKYKDSNVTEEISRESLKFGQWFMMKFTNSGLLSTVLKKDTMRMKSFIKHIMHQFNMGIDMTEHVSHTNFSSAFTAKEDSPIGTCITKYNIDVKKDADANEETDSNYQIRPLTISMNFTNQKGLRVHIVKERNNCKFLMPFVKFLNKMQMTKYVHTIEMVDDKLKMSTIINVQLPPDPWHCSGTPIFTETMLVNLINIRPQITIPYNDTSMWILHEDH